MKGRLKAWLQRKMPSAESLRANKWLRWLGPSLHHPRLWHMSRRGIALLVVLWLLVALSALGAVSLTTAHDGSDVSRNRIWRLPPVRYSAQACEAAVPDHLHTSPALVGGAVKRTKHSMVNWPAPK